MNELQRALFEKFMREAHDVVPQKDTLIKLTKFAACAICGSSTTWANNDIPVCLDDMKNMSALNSDNEEFWAPALAWLPDYTFAVASLGPDGIWYAGGHMHSNSLTECQAEARICKEDHPHSRYRVIACISGEQLWEAGIGWLPKINGTPR